MRLLARGSGRVDRSLRRSDRSNTRSAGFSPSNLRPLAWFDAELGARPPVYSGGLRLPGVTGCYVSCPDKAANSVTGDIEIVRRLAPSKWTPAAAQALCSKWTDTGNQKGWILFLDTNATLAWYISGNGTEAIAASSTSAVTGTHGSPLWLKVTWRASDGRVQFWTAPDAATEPTGGSWTQLGADRTCVTTGNVIFDNTAPICVSSYNAGTASHFAGGDYRTIVRNGIGGTVVADFDATRFTDGRPDFVDDYSNRWTLYTNSEPGYGCLQDAMLPVGGYPQTTGGGYLRLPGTSGLYISTPDTATLRVTGDIDLRCRITPAGAWNAGTYGLVARYSNAAGNIQYMLSLQPNGTLQINSSADGTAAVTGASTVGVQTVAATGATLWVRGALDVDDGAGNRVYQFHTSTDGAAWTQLGATVTTAGTTSIHAGTSALELGSRFLGTSLLFPGKIHRAQVLNGIGGTVVADFNAENLPWPARSYTDTVGTNAGVWTVNGWTPTMVGHAQLGSTSAANTNTPKMLYRADTPYVYLPNVAANNIYMLDSPTLSITGDFEIVARVQLTNWATPNSTIAHKMDSAATVSWETRVNSTGLMGLTVSPDGPTLTTVASTVAVPFGAYDWGWLKTTWRASDGRVQFWTAPDAGSETEPTGGSWTQLGTDRTAAVGSIYDGTAPICFGSWSAALSNRPEGLFSRCILRSGIGGTVVADFRASSCSQTGYTDTVGTAGGAWTINRATAGRKSTLVTTRAIALHGTDDYCLLPKGAIPSALAAADASMAVAARPWATMGSNNQWLSFRAGTGIVPGMEIVTTSATAISSRTLDAVTYITPIPGTTVTMGQQAVATMTAAAGSPGPHLLRTNSAVTALVNRTGNDETGTTYGYVGSLAGSLQFIDYELSGVLTAQAALSAVDHGRLVAYYAGGS